MKSPNAECAFFSVFARVPSVLCRHSPPLPGPCPRRTCRCFPSGCRCSTSRIAVAFPAGISRSRKVTGADAIRDLLRKFSGTGGRRCGRPPFSRKASRSIPDAGSGEVTSGYPDAWMRLVRRTIGASLPRAPLRPAPADLSRDREEYSKFSPAWASPWGQDACLRGRAFGRGMPTAPSPAIGADRAARGSGSRTAGGGSIVLAVRERGEAGAPPDPPHWFDRTRRQGPESSSSPPPADRGSDPDAFTGYGSGPGGVQGCPGVPAVPSAAAPGERSSRSRSG